jgi:hypothetical protein
MAELSASDRQELSRVIGEALMAEDTSSQPQAESLTGGGKELFCQHWALVKQILQFIAGQVGPIGWAVRAIVAAGDFLHGRICPR